VDRIGQPEAALAPQVALCYASVAPITDMDAGAADVVPLTHAQVLPEFEKDIERLRVAAHRGPRPPEERSLPVPCGHDRHGPPNRSALRR